MTPRSFTEQDLHLALDGEMPAEDRAEFDAWLDAHPDMQVRLQRYRDDRQKLDSALSPVAAEVIPPRLMTALLAPPERRRAGLTWRFAAMAAALLAVGGLGGYLAASVPGRQPPALAYAIMDDAINAHLMYANEKRHVVDVAATEAGHMNDWLSKRVGIRLVAPDLSSQGFDLVGGRLLPVGEASAAQFMYQDATGNRISLFVTRYENRNDNRYDVMSERGAEAHFWQEKGYGCAITGTMPEARMSELSKAAYREFIKAVGI